MSDDENTTSTANPGSTEQELIAIRTEKIEKLRELGIDPFGGRFETTDEIGELRENFAEEKKVTIAGRISAHRDMGKSHFFDISDFRGRIQCYVNAKGVSEWQTELGGQNPTEATFLKAGVLVLALGEGRIVGLQCSSTRLAKGWPKSRGTLAQSGSTS